MTKVSRHVADMIQGDDRRLPCHVFDGMDDFYLGPPESKSMANKKSSHDSDNAMGLSKF